MTVTQGIRTLLVSDLDVSADVGVDQDGNPKFYPDAAPQLTTIPFVLIDEDNRVPESGKNHFGSLDSIVIIVSVHDKIKQNALNIAKQIRTVLDGFKGVSDGVNIRSCGFDQQETGYTEEREIYFVEQYYTVWVNNS